MFEIKRSRNLLYTTKNPVGCGIKPGWKSGGSQIGKTDKTTLPLG